MKRPVLLIAMALSMLGGPLAAPVLKAEDLAAGFAHPQPEFSPVPIWWWSGDRLERPRLKAQLEQIAAGGIRHAIILNLAPSGPLYGSAADDPPFLSEAWWDCFGYALQQGKRVGVRLWFYDQLGFSGSGLQARVVRDHPEFRGLQLQREVRDVTGPGAFEVAVPPGGAPLAAFQARIEPPPATPGQADLGLRLSGLTNLTGQLVAGRLQATVPAGRHRLQVFYTQPGGFDYHNPAAGAALLRIVHGEMERRFGAELGKAIAGSFQDEFPPMPRFSKRLVAEFRQRCGYDLLEHLPALFDELVDRAPEHPPTTVQVRCDASRVAATMCEEAFFIPLHQWHEKHGLLCGYDQTVRNADPLGGEGYYVDYFKTMRHFSAPGNEQSGDAKPHQSMADLYNRPRVWMEGFHSSGWGQTLEEIMTLLHPWMVNGSTLYNPHAIYYSTHGSFYEWAPPDTGWRQPYYVHNRPFADYVSRLCYLLTRGRRVADVAILHPARTVHAYGGFNWPLPAAEQASKLYWAAKNALAAERLDYLIVDEDSIQSGQITNGVLRAGQARMRLIVLPGTRVLESATLRQLEAFRQSGGRVVLLGPAPEAMADSRLEAAQARALLASLSAQAVKLADAARLPGVVIEACGREVDAALPDKPFYLHRQAEGRDFYFLCTDTGTPTTMSAEFDINKRKLWENRAAQGGRYPLSLAGEGMPEIWSAWTGRRETLLGYEFRRGAGRTRLEAAFTETPAPMLALRPATPEDPVASTSSFRLSDWKRTGANTVVARGLPDLPKPGEGIWPVAEHRARMEFADGVFEGRQEVPGAVAVPMPEVYDVRLEPTLDNRDGDFAWPPSPGPLPLEVRGCKFHEETAGAETGAWKQPGFDDRAWETVLASYGPRATVAGPLPRRPGQRYHEMTIPVDGLARALEYSLRLGINKDPVYPTALGGKGRIPEEFIDLGEVKHHDVYHVRTLVTVPEEAGAALPALLRLGGATRKRAFLNGEEVRFEADASARVRRAPVTLRRGANRLDLLVSRETDGRIRLFYQFLPDQGVMPDPQWIWGTDRSPTGRLRLARALEVPGDIQSAAMVVALGELHQIRINGRLVADQGNFEPYFMGRAERYDLAAFLKPGANTLEIEARDPAPVGLLLDGLVTLKDGREVAFVSDAAWSAEPAGGGEAKKAPVCILANPSQGYLGETATLLLRPRPHPLPLGGWLLDPQGKAEPPPPFNRLVFATREEAPPAGWYRFRLPPGATSMTLPTAARAELYVDGAPVALAPVAQGFKAALAAPNAPVRMAALRLQSTAGFERGAALTAPITFETQGRGRMPLGSWDELGLPHYCGGLCYAATVTLPKAARKGRALLDLGRVRGTAEVKVNGVSCGVRLWHPYQFDLGAAAKPGANTVEIWVHNTLGPHFGVGHPSHHCFENHTQSGVFGPVTLHVVQPIEMTLRRK